MIFLFFRIINNTVRFGCIKLKIVFNNIFNVLHIPAMKTMKTKSNEDLKGLISAENFS